MVRARLPGKCLPQPPASFAYLSAPALAPLNCRYYFKRPRAFPVQQYRQLLQSCAIVLGMFSSLLYTLESGRFVLGCCQVRRTGEEGSLGWGVGAGGSAPCGRPAPACPPRELPATPAAQVCACAVPMRAAAPHPRGLSPPQAHVAELSELGVQLSAAYAAVSSLVRKPKKARSRGRANWWRPWQRGSGSGGKRQHQSKQPPAAGEVSSSTPAVGDGSCHSGRINAADGAAHAAAPAAAEAGGSGPGNGEPSAFAVTAEGDDPFAALVELGAERTSRDLVRLRSAEVDSVRRLARALSYRAMQHVTAAPSWQQRRGPLRQLNLTPGASDDSEQTWEGGDSRAMAAAKSSSSGGGDGGISALAAAENGDSGKGGAGADEATSSATDGGGSKCGCWAWAWAAAGAACSGGKLVGKQARARAEQELRVLGRLRQLALAQQHLTDALLAERRADATACSAAGAAASESLAVVVTTTLGICRQCFSCYTALASRERAESLHTYVTSLAAATPL